MKLEKQSKKMTNLIKKTNDIIEKMAQSLGNAQLDPMLEIEDLVSEAYVIIWINRENILNSSNPKMSLLRNAKNAMIDELRKQSRYKRDITKRVPLRDDIDYG